ncbi:DUF6064 family protein [Tranquillimonas alkanivorans]|uniref:Uncharacterized protein n=1 Tax=Tranquillimonas alkanivorans TaxID=441119 RepID=A0A1I5URY0_9RHOB|nr:DUF6064 family protein [Tranquillimonas alkanivorans]SFP97486.1 hypothetical protein SAMN04488047_12310 [Tranquillimonas alkanivorans]
MDLPFTQDAFFAVFGGYNQVVWPLIPLFYVLATASVAMLFRPSRGAALFIPSTLAAMWAVNGVGYHWMFFREINPAAALFAAVFVVQAMGLIVLPARIPSLRFAAGTEARPAIGLLLILFATVLYPLWGWTAGHGWPEMPAFGVAPCPTTIFTIGILLTGTWRVVRWLLIVPGLWAVVGGSAAIFLGVPQDSTLIVALVLLILFTVGLASGRGYARHSAVDAA